MIKRLLFIFSFFIFCFCCKAQSWQPLAIGGPNSLIGPFAVYNDNLYAAGDFTSPSIYIAQWNGSTWNTSTSGFNYYSAGTGIWSLLSYDSVLYASGQFNIVEGLSCKSIAQWNGTNWDTLGPGLIANGGESIAALATWNGKLYAGGEYADTIGGKILIGIGVWDGKNWDTLGKGIYGQIYTLADYNGRIYTGGQFDVGENKAIQDIATWDGTKWDSVKIGRAINGALYTMEAFNGKLYVAGDFIAAGGIPMNNIASWDGTKWDSLGTGLNSDVFSLCVYDGMLIAGGSFDSAGGKPASEIAAWDGTNWHTIGNSLQGGNTGVYALGIYDSALYAGGDFTASGGTALNNIAVWQGPLGVNELGIRNQGVSVFPNPSNGVFTFSTQQVSERLQVDIYNMLGEEIYNTQFKATTMQVDLSGQAQGVYLYRVVTEKGEAVASGKLIITN